MKTLAVAMGAICLGAWQTAPTVSDAEIEAAPAEEWLSHGRDYAETHYSPLDQINTANVTRLGPAWSVSVGAPGDVRATPLYHDGVVYGTVGDGVLFAVDARTGALLWRWDPEIPETAFQEDDQGNRVLDADGRPIRIGPSTCCGGRFNRGVALYRGKVYAGLLDGRLVALDAGTGDPLWQVEAADYRRDYSITQAPRIVKGNVIIGNSGAEYGVRGYVSAYDAETGDLVWRFYTVPGNPADGFENAAMEMAAKTWSGEWWRMGGGGTVWDALAYDPALDLLYVGTGNGGPWAQRLRSPGGGDNLFLSSIVALRPSTGEYVWHYQTTPGDTWDYTATQGMILADLEIQGRVRQVLMQAPKNGFFYVLDRRTGELLSAKPFVDVTWASGIDMRTGRPVENPAARYGIGECVLLSPNSGGAHNWNAMSFDPESGLVFIPAFQGSMYFTQDPNFEFEAGRFNIGNGLIGPGQFNGPRPCADMPPSPTPLAFLLIGWDPVRQEERWRITGQGPVGSTLATAGGLVFTASGRAFAAHETHTGSTLWSVDVTTLGTPVSYMMDGRQYVLVLAIGEGDAAPSVLAFTLDGPGALPGNPGRSSTR